MRPQARLDAAEIAVYVAGDNPDVAEAFVAELEKTYESLARMPLMGVKRDHSSKTLQGLRMVPMQTFRKHLVFYLPANTKTVEIVRVLHSAREIPVLIE